MKSCPIKPGKFVFEKLWVDENNINDDIACDVCIGMDDDSDDEIVVCDGCNAASHRSCYGKELIYTMPAEDQDWYCERCKKIEQHDDWPLSKIKCIFCDDL